MLGSGSLGDNCGNIGEGEGVGVNVVTNVYLLS